MVESKTLRSRPSPLPEESGRIAPARSGCKENGWAVGSLTCNVRAKRAYYDPSRSGRGEAPQRYRTMF